MLIKTACFLVQFPQKTKSVNGVPTSVERFLCNFYDKRVIILQDRLFEWSFTYLEFMVSSDLQNPLNFGGKKYRHLSEKARLKNTTFLNIH